MPRMTDLDIKRWKDRLRFSHVVFAEQGLAKNIPGAMADTDAWRLARAYRGDQWNGPWAGVWQEHLMVTTTLFASANTFVKQLSARDPKVTVFPRRPEAADDARIVEALLNYDIRELKMRRQWNRVLRDALFYPFGISRLGFTPSEEKFDNKSRTIETYDAARPDKPWLRRWAPWDTRIDPHAESPDPDGDARWVGFRSLLTEQDIKRNPNFIFRDGMTPTVSMDRREIMPRVMREGADPERNEFFEVWHLYELEERTWWAFAEGVDKPIRERDDWPAAYDGIDGLPFQSLYFNEQTDESLFPVPYMQAIWKSVEERNKIRTLMAELVKRMRRILAVNKDRLEDGEENKLFGDFGPDLAEIIGKQGAEQIFEQINVGGFDQNLLAYDAVIQEDIREALGQSLMDRGQRINVETAQEAGQVQRGSDVSTIGNQDAFETYLRHSMRQYAQARAATATDDELIPILGVDDVRILGNEDSERWLRATPEQLRNEYLFEIEVGSTLPRNRQQESAVAVANLEVANKFGADAHNQPQLLIDYWRAQGKDPTRYLLNVNELGATQQTPEQTAAQAAQANGGAPPPDANFIDAIGNL